MVEFSFTFRPNPFQPFQFQFVDLFPTQTWYFSARWWINLPFGSAAEMKCLADEIAINHLQKFHAIDQIDGCRKSSFNGEWFIHFYRNLPWEILRSPQHQRATHWSFNLRFQDAIKNKLAQTSRQNKKILN